MTLTQDGIPVASGSLPSGALKRIGVSGGHWGLYAGGDIRQCTLLNDNITLAVYPTISP